MRQPSDTTVEPLLSRTHLARALRSRGSLAVILVVALGVTVVGCDVAATGSSTRRVSPTESARNVYFAGMEELVDGNFTQSMALFNQVARSPRYVRHAALARLRLGDSLYFQERYEEAIEIYRSFTAQYGSDANLPYARFMIASAYFERLPAEWFLTPPAYEKDQSMTRQAVRELQGFLKTFPTSRFASAAREKLAEARSMLLDHELYVADYYDVDEHARAVAWRLDHAIKTYGVETVTEEDVWRMAGAYSRAAEDATAAEDLVRAGKDRADAARSYALYLDKFPKGARRADARLRLDEIRLSLEPPDSE